MSKLLIMFCLNVAYAHPDFGRIEGAALLLAHSDFQTLRDPCKIFIFFRLKTPQQVLQHQKPTTLPRTTCAFFFLAVHSKQDNIIYLLPAFTIPVRCNVWFDNKRAVQLRINVCICTWFLIEYICITLHTKKYNIFYLLKNKQC